MVISIWLGPQWSTGTVVVIFFWSNSIFSRGFFFLDVKSIWGFEHICSNPHNNTGLRVFHADCYNNKIKWKSPSNRICLNRAIVNIHNSFKSPTELEGTVLQEKIQLLGIRFIFLLRSKANTRVLKSHIFFQCCGTRAGGSPKLFETWSRNRSWSRNQSWSRN